VKIVQEYERETMRKVDLRIVMLEVPAQEAITRDNVTIQVDAVVYFRVVGLSDAVVKAIDFIRATSRVGQTTLRSIPGQSDLDHLLTERDRINQRLQEVIDQQTSAWGVKVTSVEVRDIKLPDTMQRAIAKQAEAECEKRAKIIHAEDEFTAAEKNSTIVFPLPIDLIQMFLESRHTGVSRTDAPTNGDVPWPAARV
jgi:regulator of protease activity HflC (stomatin/prohibitin superfamily)